MWCVVIALALGAARVAATGDGTPPIGAPAYDAERQSCVDITNAFRQKASLPPLTRSPALEEYADAAAKNDGTAHGVHQYFKRMRGHRPSMAENELPWWSLSNNATIGRLIRTGIEMMWAEGASGGHYKNLAGPFKELGCGIYVHGDEVTVVQSFR